MAYTKRGVLAHRRSCQARVRDPLLAMSRRLAYDPGNRESRNHQVTDRQEQVERLLRRLTDPLAALVARGSVAPEIFRAKITWDCSVTTSLNTGEGAPPYATVIFDDEEKERYFSLQLPD
jgi:hypothetical protein